MSFYNYPEWSEEEKVKFLKQLDETITKIKEGVTLLQQAMTEQQKAVESLAIELDRVGRIADRLDEVYRTT